LKSNPRGDGRITGRSVALGLALMVVHTIWLIEEELALQHIGTPTYFLLVPTVVGLLFTLMGWNSIARRIAPRLVLAPSELAVVFVLNTIGAIVTARNLLHYLFPTILRPLHAPDATGGPATRAAISHWTVPSDPAVVERFYNGTRDPWAIFRPENLVPWLVPLAFWSVFFLLLLTTMMCLASLVRRPWVDYERVPFPIVDLPVRLARDNHLGALFADRTLAVGFFVSATLLSLNYVSSLVPTVPGIKMAENDIGSAWITSPPWSTVAPLLTVWWPYAIGLCYLIPLDVSFSSWFFFILLRLLAVAATAVGWRTVATAQDPAQFPWFENASEGAWIGMFVVLAWSARRFWKQSPADREIEQRAEAIPHRWAVVGAVLGYVLLVALGIGIGMRPAVAILAFALFFLAVVVMTRMVAQVALPLFVMAWFSFTGWTARLVGTANLARPEAVALTQFHWFDRTYEQIPMAHHLESLVMADRIGAQRRTFMKLVFAATAIAIPLGMATLLQIFYERGAESARVATDTAWFAGFNWSRFNDWTANPKPFDPAPLARAGGSALIVGALSWARNRWIGWPLHPVGYLFATSYALEWGQWNIVFVTWLIKTLVLRYGGLGLYRRTVPFFLGLALGDAVTKTAWGIFLGATGITGASPY